MKRQPQTTVLDRPLVEFSTAFPPLDQRLVRSSRKRLVLCGNYYELYTYEQPFRFNWPPERNVSYRSTGGTRSRSERLDHLRMVRQRLRRLVATNVGSEVPKFVTFTFAENVRSLREANRLWRLFAKRFAYEFGRRRYLTVVEFQRRGAVHYHTLIFDMPYTRGLKARLAGAWGHGFVHVKGIAHVRNVPAYMTKYLQKDLVDSRLDGNKAYFGSRNLLRPIEIRSEAEVASFCEASIMAKRLERVYTSAHFGQITYQQGELVKP